MVPPPAQEELATLRPLGQQLQQPSSPKPVSQQSLAQLYPTQKLASLYSIPAPTAKMQVLAEAASREAENQKQQQQQQQQQQQPQLLRRITTSGNKSTRLHSFAVQVNHSKPQLAFKQLGLQTSNAAKSNSVPNLAKLPNSNLVLKQHQPKAPRSLSVANIQSTQQQHQQHQQQQQQQQQQMLVKVSTPLNATGKPSNSKTTKLVHRQLIVPQSGCIKTLPQKNNALQLQAKANAVKLNSASMANINVVKGVPTSVQSMPMLNPLQTTKASVKTIAQQNAQLSAVPANLGLVHKLSTPAGKIVHQHPPQPMQAQAQKQLVMAASAPPLQYASPGRPLAGQVKTIIPVGLVEPKKENDIKIEIKTEIKQEDDAVTSSQYHSQKRMPLPYECLQFVLQDHNYGAPPPRTPPPPSPPPHPVVVKQSPPVNGAQTPMGILPIQHPFGLNQVAPIITPAPVEDDAASAISSDTGREVEPEGEETETAPEGEGDEEDSVTRCICDFEHDDGYMICCDRCLVWQHVDCMGIDRANIPDEYLCERCRPRRVDRTRARLVQMRKCEELRNLDTASDSSSSSSGDSDTGQNVPVKNRKVAQQSGARRKNDSAPVRRLNNNNNVAKRQRRDSQRQPSAIRNKKETPTQAAKQQRQTGKRKTKRRTSLEDKDEDVQDAWGSNMAPLRQWIERYEEAVTNHYSPELRARISSIKVNGTHNDLKQSNIGTAATGKCRLNIQSNSLRFLVATMYLAPNTPVIELRGKYMLSTQHRPSHPQGRQHAQRPGPFVFFYRLPRDGTEVCVDTRTYGNDARFVRRSCKPNAEVKHCIEKGTLHLYIVTTAAIDKNAEITIRHDQHDLVLSPNSNSSIMPLMCACNNPKECQIATLNTPPSNRRGNNGPLAENADGRERRRRGRRNTVNEDTNEVSNPVATPTASSSTAVTPAVPATSPAPAPSTPVQPTPKKTVTINPNVIVRESPSVGSANTANNNSSTTNASPSTSNSTPAVTRQAAKEEQQQQQKHQHQQQQQKQQQQQQSPQQPSVSALSASIASVHTPTKTASAPPKQLQQKTAEPKKDKKKMTREERKLEAIMKAIERMEKAEQRKQEVQARNAQRKDGHSDNDESVGQVTNKPKQSNPEKGGCQKRKGRKGRTRSTSGSQSQGSGARRSRLNSAESDLTSGDESNSMQSPPLPNQNCSYSLRMHAAKEPSSSGNNSAQIPAAADLLLALANSNVAGSTSPQQRPTPAKSPTCDSSSSSQSSTPSTPLSSACMLVAAAVGPLAPGFKFPKTKKVLMNEWLKESPEPQCQPMEARGSEFPNEPTSDSLSQKSGAKSIATLVQAATAVSGVTDSPLQQRDRQQCSAAVAAAVAAATSMAPSGGSAKKRWLRQAISEECDSPNGSSRPESPPSEMVAPPKKRRIARESISSDNYTPPTTPTMMLQESASAAQQRPTTVHEDEYMEHLPSPSTEDMGSQNEYDSDIVKDELKVRFADEVDKKWVNSSIICNSAISKYKSKCNLGMKTKDEIKLEEEDKVMSKCKAETKFSSRINSVTPKFEKEPVKIEEIIEQGTVEIIDQNEQDLEADDMSSPIAAMESEAELKKRVAELRLEFSGGIPELANSSAETDKSFDDINDSEKQEEDKSADHSSLDEFDVEAQMKKLTGDDGDDYKEKFDTSSEKDKSVDGIEGLMESSKEDSESDVDNRDAEESKDCSDSTIKHSEQEKGTLETEERVFKEFECKKRPMSLEEEFEEIEKSAKSALAEMHIRPHWIDRESLDSIEKEIEEQSGLKKIDLCFGNALMSQEFKTTLTPEESMMELDSMELPSEETSQEPPKVFPSIPPLSERIRKKADSNPAVKSKLDEASIIESSLDLELAEDEQTCEEKKIMSTAFRELLEAKIEPEDEPAPPVVNKVVLENKVSPEPQINPVKEALIEKPVVEPCTVTPPVVSEVKKDIVVLVAKEEEPSLPEPKRLKDPRTAVPNKLTNPSPSKSDGPPPIKRKLSITEYRKRKQQSSETPLEPENSENSADGKTASRGRSDSASSGTSSLSSDDESTPKTSLELPSLSTLPLFANAEGEEKKAGNEDGTIGWSAAPTLVERQRENLTERLKREFGLFLNDDEEERARKQGLSNEAILKTAATIPPTIVTSANFPVAQLPPQPYIPPPGSASIHYSQYPPKVPGSSVVQYPNYSVPPPPVGAPNYPPPPIGQAVIPTGVKPAGTTNQPPFVLPQAPPGSNPYPPAQPQFPTTVVTTKTVTHPVTVTPVPPPVPAPSPVPPPSTTITRFTPASTQATVPPVLTYSMPPPPLPQTQKTFYNHPAPRS